MNDSGLLRAICERLSSDDNRVSELEAQLGAEAIAAVLYENGTAVYIMVLGTSRTLHNLVPMSLVLNALFEYLEYHRAQRGGRGRYASGAVTVLEAAAAVPALTSTRPERDAIILPHPHASA